MKMEIIEQTISVLEGVEGLKLAIIYGSAVSGTMRGDSDVDLAVLFDHVLEAEQKIELNRLLAQTLRRDVDLVDLAELSGTILKQILCKGRVVIKKDPQALANLYKRMIYNQTDMMPYVIRTLEQRQQRFING